MLSQYPSRIISLVPGANIKYAGAKSVKNIVNNVLSP